MASVSGVTVNTSSFIAAAHGYESRLKAALFLLADTSSKKMEAWAKQNARWTDRTSNARQTLKGEALWESDVILLCLVKHGVDYGIWLELAHEKRYAILEEAVAAYRDELITEFKRLVGVR